MYPVYIILMCHIVSRMFVIYIKIFPTLSKYRKCVLNSHTHTDTVKSFP